MCSFPAGNSQLKSLFCLHNVTRVTKFFCTTMHIFECNNLLLFCSWLCGFMRSKKFNDKSIFETLNWIKENVNFLVVFQGDNKTHVVDNERDVSTLSSLYNWVNKRATQSSHFNHFYSSTWCLMGDVSGSHVFFALNVKIILSKFHVIPCLW